MKTRIRSDGQYWSADEDIGFNLLCGRWRYIVGSFSNSREITVARAKAYAEAKGAEEVLDL